MITKETIKERRLKRKNFIFSLFICSLLCLGHQTIFKVDIAFSGFVFGEHEPVIMIGLGDSIGEGVQSADASNKTQMFSYLNLLASHLGLYIPLPEIATDFVAWIGNTEIRTRINPQQYTFNLAVSGADVHSLLFDRANAITEAEIDSETDLVLFPWLGSQIEIAEYLSQLAPTLIVCWIGNNDVLSAALSYDQMDGSQMTPVAEFQKDFDEIIERLAALNSPTIIANIPDVTSIAFLIDRDDLIRFLGNDYGLEEGSFTSLVAMLLIKLGFDDGSIISDPNAVLDASEISLIQERINVFNQIIAESAENHNIPVVDINGLFTAIIVDPPIFFDYSITPRFLEGMFSLDGVHPSNLGHILVAEAFINKLNEHYNIQIPPIDDIVMDYFFITDPFIDKDGDGKATGRFGAGLLESLGPIIGISGDFDDFTQNMILGDNQKTGQSSVYEELSPSDRSVTEIGELTREKVIECFKKLYGRK